MTTKNLLQTLILGLALSSCGDDDNTTQTTQDLQLNISGLESLGDDFVYEGWLIVDGVPKSTGRFQDPELKKQAVNIIDLNAATSFVLSIEPAQETGQELIDPAPTKLFKADFNGNTAPIAFGTINSTFADITSAKDQISGDFFLRTPTDDTGGVNNMNDEAGVWFGTPGTMPPAASLELPVLDAASGWTYEGWAVVNGVPYSTGTFLDPKMADDNAETSEFKGTVNSGPPIPGEDFINNLASTSFPSTGADLRNSTIVISIEPVPDNNAKPFLLKPLVGDSETETAPSKYEFKENLKSFPTGTINR